MFKSLKAKLLIIMFFVIITPLAILGITSLIRFSNTIEEEVYSKLDDLVSLNVKVIQGELDAAHLIGSLLSQNNELANFVSGDKSLKIGRAHV